MSLNQIWRQSGKIGNRVLSNGRQFSVLSGSGMRNNNLNNKNNSNINNTTTTNNLTLQQKREYRFKGVYLHPGPGEIDLDDGAQKPEGVPDTWTTIDIHDNTYGIFDENTFPPAIEGETLEQYCRRVPNIWSPCSNATDVVDVITHMELVYAVDRAPSKMSYFLEEALVKIPPESADWHVTYVPDYEGMLREMCFRNRPFPVRVSEAEFDKMLSEFEKGVQDKGLDYHFRARTIHEFWEELTGHSLQDIANVPTWEEEMDRRMELAQSKIAAMQLEKKQQQSINQ